MPTYHVKCYETVNFTVNTIEAESEQEGRELDRDIRTTKIAESTIRR